MFYSSAFIPRSAAAQQPSVPDPHRKLLPLPRVSTAEIPAADGNEFALIRNVVVFGAR
jgi:hypothetical protein